MKCLIAFLMPALVIILLPGCGAMFQGSSQTIDIQSMPAGALVTAEPGIGQYTTPASVSLARKHSYELTFEKEGYKPAKAHIRASAKFGYIVLDVLFTGLIGVVVDAVTGGWNGLNPDTIVATLEKEDQSSLGPKKIDIRLSTNGPDLLMDSGDDTVLVTIKKID